MTLGFAAALLAAAMIRDRAGLQIPAEKQGGTDAVYRWLRADRAGLRRLYRADAAVCRRGAEQSAGGIECTQNREKGPLPVAAGLL